MLELALVYDGRIKLSVITKMAGAAGKSTSPQVEKEPAECLPTIDHKTSEYDASDLEML